MSYHDIIIYVLYELVFVIIMLVSLSQLRQVHNLIPPDDIRDTLSERVDRAVCEARARIYFTLLLRRIRLRNNIDTDIYTHPDNLALFPLSPMLVGVKAVVELQLMTAGMPAMCVLLPWSLIRKPSGDPKKAGQHNTVTPDQVARKLLQNMKTSQS